MLDERFWNKVNKRGPKMPHMETRCWLWTGALRTNGYGQVRRERKNKATHRHAYELRYGPIPDGLHIDHLCRVITCVRPSHLEAVTQTENNARTADPDFCRNGHPRADNTYTRKSDGRHECRECGRIRGRERYARKVGKA